MIVVYVNDVKKTVEFYKKVFNLETVAYHPDGSYAHVQMNECIVGFVKTNTAEYPIQEIHVIDVPQAFSLVYTSKNVIGDYNNAIRNGAKVLNTPHETHWAKQVAVVSDINGVVITISGESKPEYMKEMIKI